MTSLFVVNPYPLSSVFILSVVEQLSQKLIDMVRKGSGGTSLYSHYFFVLISHHASNFSTSVEIT